MAGGSRGDGTDTAAASPIVSRTGMAWRGGPLASSRRPQDDIAPWFDWISMAEGELPPDATVSCRMLSDQTCLRLLWGGTWTAETADGPRVFEPGSDGMALYFGPQTRSMPISVTGSFRTVTINFVAGAPRALKGPQPRAFADRIAIVEDLGELAVKVPPDQDYGRRIAAVESELRRYLAQLAPARPGRLSTAFERECLASPDFVVSDFARAQGVSPRTLERVISRDFGASPKLVQRRARALDMAAVLLGVARSEEEAEMRLRYFDQSHLIREMRFFFGMPPSQLARGAHPLLRLNVETRQHRRMRALEELDQLERAGTPPWRDPAAEPQGGID